MCLVAIQCPDRLIDLGDPFSFRLGRHVDARRLLGCLFGLQGLYSPRRLDDDCVCVRPLRTELRPLCPKTKAGQLVLRETPNPAQGGPKGFPPRCLAGISSHAVVQPCGGRDMMQRRTRYISLRMTPATHDALLAEARVQGVSRSLFVRRLIVQDLRQRIAGRHALGLDRRPSVTPCTSGTHSSFGTRPASSNP